MMEDRARRRFIEEGSMKSNQRCVLHLAELGEAQD